MDMGKEIVEVLHGLLISWHHLRGDADPGVTADVLRQRNFEFLNSRSISQPLSIRNIRR